MEKLTKAQQADVDSICQVLGIEILEADKPKTEQEKSEQNIDEIMSLIK